MIFKFKKLLHGHNVSIIFFILFILIFIKISIDYSMSNKLVLKSIDHDYSLKDLKKYKNGVLCLILTTDKTIISRGIPVWNTWAKKCEKTLFALNAVNFTSIISQNNSRKLFNNDNEYETALNLPLMNLNIIETYDDMGTKVLEVVKNAYNDNKEFKWYLLTDDDTFIFVDQLNAFISNRNHNEPFTYGYNFNAYLPTGYHSGGAGNI